MRTLDLDVSEWFVEDGPLANGNPGYRVRDAQIELAQAIDLAIKERTTLVAEAGTGTGKTWAYLIPSFVNGGKVLVSTGTRTLQDQLYNKDVPKLLKTLGLPVYVTLLKGRGNYVCHFHLARIENDERSLRSKDEVQQLRFIRDFAGKSRSGDKSECVAVPEDADIWYRVTSTRENCLNQDCPNVKDCFVLKARRNAQEADVVIINHALFFADLMLKEEGITDLLPSADTVIFDEAHQLPDTATRFMGESIAGSAIADMIKTGRTAGLVYARDSARWDELSDQVDSALKALRLVCAPIAMMNGQKVTYENFSEQEEFNKKYDELLAALDYFSKVLTAAQERHPDIASVAKVAVELTAKLYRWNVASLTAKKDKTETKKTPEPANGAIGPTVRWIEMGMHHFRLNSAPLSVAEAFSKHKRKDQAWIFASATLSVYKDFSHFTRQLGLYKPTTHRWESPFDYADKGLLYVPAHLPETNSNQFAPAFIKDLVPLIKKSMGGVLVLCTTLRAVELYADMLREAFDNQQIDRPLLRQGESSRGFLLDKFRKLKNAVLVGSASFWEGVDIPGDALTLVAIDKLPFAPPDDPVLEARINACKEEGGNPFMEFQIPAAAIALKQGAGRLIRTEKDWGVLMIADARLVDKKYGALLWRGLPPFSRTRNAEVAAQFLADHD